MNELLSVIQVLLIVIATSIVLIDNNRTIVIYLAAFSLFSASLYFFNHAPDVALAEVAIGSAIMPLLYMISIAKQREFIVVNKVGDDLLPGSAGHSLLLQFTEHFNLKLLITTVDQGEITGIFRQSNIDLIVLPGQLPNSYLVKGNKSSLLLDKLEDMLIDYPNVKIVRVKAGDLND